MRKAALIILTAFIFIARTGAPRAGAEEKSEKSNEYFYILNYRFMNADGSIELNGVPMAESEKKYNYSTTGFSDVGMWVMPGNNRAIITIRSMNKSENPRVEFSVSIARKGQMSDEGVKIVEFLIPEKSGDEAATLAKIKFPFKKEIEFTPDYPPPSELWSRAKTAPLNPAAKKKITKLISDLHRAMVNKDANRVYELFKFKAADVSRLRYDTADESGTKFKEQIKSLLAMKGMKFEALKTERLAFRLLAGGKVVWVTEGASKSPIRTTENKDLGRLEFPIYVSYIEDAWVIVR